MAMPGTIKLSRNSFYDCRTSLSSSGVSGRLGYIVVGFFMHDKTLAHDVFCVVVTTDAPFISCHGDGSITRFIIGKVSDVTFVMFGIAPFSMLFKSWIPVPARRGKITRTFGLFVYMNGMDTRFHPFKIGGKFDFATFFYKGCSSGNAGSGRRSEFQIYLFVVIYGFATHKRRNSQE